MGGPVDPRLVVSGGHLGPESFLRLRLARWPLQ